MADIGIVMPVYKQNDNLFRQAIRSILRQTYRNFKLVIVIDGVTPNVLRIARNFKRRDKRIVIIAQRQNRGTSRALNIGFRYLMRLNRIKYLTWVSSDNVYYPNCFKLLRRKLRNSPPKVGFVHSSFRFVDVNRTPVDVEKMKGYVQWQSQQTKEDLLEMYYIGYAFLYKKRFARIVGGYRYTPVEDYDYFLRLFEVCDMRFVPKILMDFRIRTPHSNSLELRNSPEKYRHKRYILNLITLEARHRRGIPPETTVLFPVSDASPHTIAKLEHLLEQVYTNYKLLIIDTSPNLDASAVINQIPDPRIEFIFLPNGTTPQAIQTGLAQVSTPFVMFYSKNANFVEIDEMDHLIKAARNTPHLPSVTSIPPHAEPAYQLIYHR
ncbi:glycosyltransferase family 2 protein [Brevibacillus sp. SYSU BS000544]|uniref:glycosyltransferase family 2 protein n=1 Tax=Brevibacillus sp. SYSU BS000544 TaxID=3416443 RepID=UPI003CE52555